jgi:hypothetical protein
MNDRTAVARSALAWVVPFALVVAALGYETHWGRSVTRDAPVPAATAPQPLAVALLPEYRIDGGVDARKETVERVLFNPTRRPAPPAAPAAAATAMQRGQYTLTGTTVVGNVATAFLREVNGGKSRSVRRGETLGNVIVADVKPDYVRLTQGDEFEDLRLKIAAGPKTTVQPPPPVAAAPQPAQVAQQPAAPNATAAAAAPTSNVAELLANRRRAARAAAAAAGGSNGGAPQPPAPGVAPAAPVPGPQSAVQQGDPHWNAVYQRMQQRQQQQQAQPAS